MSGEQKSISPDTSARVRTPSIPLEPSATLEDCRLFSARPVSGLRTRLRTSPDSLRSPETCTKSSPDCPETGEREWGILSHARSYGMPMPALPPTTDTRFQEMLTRALAVPHDEL